MFPFDDVIMSILAMRIEQLLHTISFINKSHMEDSCIHVKKNKLFIATVLCYVSTKCHLVVLTMLFHCVCSFVPPDSIYLDRTLYNTMGILIPLSRLTHSIARRHAIAFGLWSMTFVFSSRLHIWSAINVAHRYMVPKSGKQYWFPWKEGFETYAWDI